MGREIKGVAYGNTRAAAHADSGDRESHPASAENADSRPASDLPAIRQTEFATVLTWIVAARGGDATPLVIVGPSGVGKTFIWEAARAAADASRGDEGWVYAKVGQVDQRPYGVITQILAARPQLTAEVLRDAGSSSALRSFVLTIAPSVSAYLPSPVASDYSSLSDPPAALASLLTRLALAQSGQRVHAIMCVDDYQWIDSYSRRVIIRLLEHDGGPAVALLTRGSVEAESIADFSCSPLVVPLRSLTRDETREFVEVLGAREADDAPGPQITKLTESTLSRLYDLSQGNPLAITGLLRGGMREDALTGDVLTAIANERLATLPAETQTILRVVGIVGSPVSLEHLRQSGAFSQTAVDRAVASSEAARLVYRGRSAEVIHFSHDSVETAARRAGEDDPAARRFALDMLLAAARSGIAGAAYTGARLLESDDQAEIAPDDWALIFTAASREAVASLAPMEAITLAESGLRRATGRARVLLVATAHEAAYLAADRELMSRYYRRIVVEGDDDDVAEARYLWVRSCYADSRFPGAIATGVRLLARLPVVSVPFDWSADEMRSREFLDRRSPRSVLREIRRRGRSTDPTVTRAADTLSRMLLPTMTVEHRKLAHLARFALELALDRGWTPFTGFGFIAWVVYRTFDRTPGPWVRPYFDSAEAIALDSGDPTAAHSVRMLSTGFGMHWYSSYDAFVSRLAQLEESGRSQGNWEYVAHCIHLRRQALLYRGAPLSDVQREMDAGRREIRGYGLVRTDKALAKYHQATETLLGLAPDPTRLDGRIIREDEVYRAIVASGDRISMAGYRTAKALLSFFADRPDLVVEQLTLIDEVLPAISLFHEHTILPFYLGVSAYRVGQTSHGDRARVRLRRLARAVPQTFFHRYLFVLAERDVHDGRLRRAHRRLDRARRLAEARGYLSEAAMLYERQGDIAADTHSWRAAVALYLEWGAEHAVARVRTKLRGASVAELPLRPSIHVPMPLERDLAEAHTVDAIVEILARSIVAASLPAEITAVLYDRTSGIEQTVALVADGTGFTRKAQSSPDVRLILGELITGESRIIPPKELRRSDAPALAVRSPLIGGAECAVLVVGPRESPAYTEQTLRVAEAAVRSVAPALALAAVRSRLDADEAALAETRQQLGRTEEYRRELFATVSDAFLLLDAHGAVVFSNRAAATYLVRTEDGSHRLLPAINDMVLRLATLSDQPPQPLELSLPDGGRSVQVRLAPVESATASPLFAVSIYDVTEAVERETRIAQQERRLIVADRLAAIGTFSAAIAHEISNPNHILQLNTQSLSVVLSWLSSETSDDPTSASTVSQAHQLLQQVEDAAQRIESVLQLVKSYGREGRTEHWGELDLNVVAARAFRFSRIMAAQHSDHVRIVSSEEPIVVRGESALLEQAIVNLIRNACEALFDRDGRVELHVGRQAGVGVVSICDTGRGFPEELRTRLATPFTTGRAESGGTGLGLSIVAGIVEKHRGALTVESEAPFSTCVRLSIPTDQPVV